MSTQINSKESIGQIKNPTQVGLDLCAVGKLSILLIRLKLLALALNYQVRLGLDLYIKSSIPTPRFGLDW